MSIQTVHDRLTPPPIISEIVSLLAGSRSEPNPVVCPLSDTGHDDWGDRHGHCITALRVPGAATRAVQSRC